MHGKIFSTYRSQYKKKKNRLLTTNIRCLLLHLYFVIYSMQKHIYFEQLISFIK